MIAEVLMVVLIGVGTSLSLLAAIGVFRMPDLYLRIQAATKCSTLGLTCLVLAAAIRFGETGSTARALLIIAFLFLTTPIAAHMIGRAGYSAGVPLWQHSKIDELQQDEHEVH